MTNNIIGGHKSNKFDEFIIKLFSKNPVLGMFSALVLLPCAVLMAIAAVAFVIIMPITIITNLL